MSDGDTPEEETLEGVTLPQVGQYAAPAGSCVPHTLHCIRDFSFLFCTTQAHERTFRLRCSRHEDVKRAECYAARQDPAGYA